MLTSLRLLSPDQQTVLAEGEALARRIGPVTVVERDGRPGEASFRPGPAHDPAFEVGPRQVLELGFDDGGAVGTSRRYRVSRTRSVHHGASAPTRVELRPIEMDLGGAVYRETVDEAMIAGFSCVATPVAEALERLLTPGHGVPMTGDGDPLFVPGMVDPALADERVWVARDGVTILEALTALVQSLAGDVPGRVVWRAHQVGEQTAIDLIVEPPSTPPKLLPATATLELREDLDAELHRTAVVPVGVYENTTHTIAEATWRVRQVAGHPDGALTLVLAGRPVWADAALDGLAVDLDGAGTLFLVTASYAPNVVEVAAPEGSFDEGAPEIDPPRRVRFVHADGSPLVAIERWTGVDAEEPSGSPTTRLDRVEEVVRVSALPSANLIDVEPGEADLGLETPTVPVPLDVSGLAMDVERLSNHASPGYKNAKLDSELETDAVALRGRRVTLSAELGAEAEILHDEYALAYAQVTLSIAAVDQFGAVVAMDAVTRNEDDYGSPTAAGGSDGRLVDSRCEIVVPDDAVTLVVRRAYDVTVQVTGHHVLRKARARARATGLALVASDTVVDAWQKTHGQVDWQLEFDEALLETAQVGLRVAAGRWQGVTFTVDKSSAPYTSCWVQLYLISGRVQVELVDLDTGLRYPDREAVTDALADPGVPELRVLAVGGQQILTHGDTGARRVALRITAHGGPAEWVLDAVTMTDTGTPQAWQPRMGPQALWHEGARRFSEASGLSRLDAGWIDLSTLGPSPHQPLRLGDRVQIALERPPSDGISEVRLLQSRLAEVEHTYSLGDPAPFCRGRLDDGTSTRYQTGGIKPPPPVRPPINPGEVVPAPPPSKGVEREVARLRRRLDTQAALTRVLADQVADGTVGGEVQAEIERLDGQLGELADALAALSERTDTAESAIAVIESSLAVLAQGIVDLDAELALQVLRLDGRIDAVEQALEDYVAYRPESPTLVATAHGDRISVVAETHEVPGDDLNVLLVYRYAGESGFRSGGRSEGGAYAAFEIVVDRVASVELYAVTVTRDGRESPPAVAEVPASAAPDVTDLRVTPMNHAFVLSWSQPDDRRLTGIRLRVASHTSEAALEGSFDEVAARSGVVADEFETTQRSAVYPISRETRHHGFRFWADTLCRT